MPGEWVDRNLVGAIACLRMPWWVGPLRLYRGPTESLECSGWTRNPSVPSTVHEGAGARTGSADVFALDGSFTPFRSQLSEC